MSLLEVRDLEICLQTRSDRVTAVDGLSFAIERGGSLGIVGESGSGKTQTALAILGLLAPTAQVTGSVRWQGRELLGMPRRELNAIRGAQIALVSQDPMTSLNPCLRVGVQMAEVLQHHRAASRRDALRESAQMLDALQIADAVAQLARYPHELSGGMRQRVAIAMALLCKPQLLIADEPTTALDATVQAQVLEQLARVRRDLGVALMLITHNVALVAALCEHTLVLYGGDCMESGPTSQVLGHTRHPYTRGLLASRPRLDQSPSESLRAIPGQAPASRGALAACPFAPRCAWAQSRCHVEKPRPAVADGILRACHAAPEAVR